MRSAATVGNANSALKFRWQLNQVSDEASLDNIKVEANQ